MKIILVFLLLWSSGTFAAEKVFRLHLSNEPGGLDPNRQRTSSSSYILGNLYRNIFSYDDQKGLVPDLGTSCKRDKKQNLTCTLKKDLVWSDGTPLTSEDFLRTYKKILNSKTAAPRADLLFKIKNAEEIYAGKKGLETLGVTTPDKLTLKFEFQTSDPDFEYNLANFLLAPTKEDLSSYNGPYKLKEWKKGQKIILEANTLYKGGHPARPNIEFLFVEEDTVALQLYEKNELQFLRRLPTLFIPTYKTRKDFYWYPVIRLDYLGFGPELADQEDVRKAFTYSLNYVELQKIFSSEGKPGCIGLPDSWFPEKAPCYDYDLKKVPAVKSTKTYTLMFSALGGEDHKRATEWLQNQWSKNASLKTHLEVKENKVFLQILQQNPPALFRKGVSPDRPTCLAALETFAPSSPENYLRIKSPEYQKILSSLAQAKKPAEQKKWCLSGTEYLMKNHLMIPLGAIHFSILVKPEFIGWKLNQMNQLDLSDLHLKP
ncbi:peptide ABC transporter substrate-binding protein [Bdellovibrio sp. HCB-110]|uniref:peptide ABC transporter substrate-binding protein n=1 Tax=Bdellovibrio sp. HCB-110 TaxID=3391182 RepID=UPI0039B54F95